MRTESRAAIAAEQILTRIIEGDLAPGEKLPAEATLADELDVSRLTVREALKTLQSQGVVRAVHGKRGVVNPVQAWRGLGPTVRMTVRQLGSAEASLQLLEMRRMIEVGAASLAAERRSAAQCDRLDEQVTAMAKACEAGDVEAFVAADIAFHDEIFAATHNEFVRLVFEPLHAVLLERRRETSAVPEVQHNALACHRRLTGAIRAADSMAARDAMVEHMDQTNRDLTQLVLFSGRGSGPSH